MRKQNTVQVGPAIWQKQKDNTFTRVVVYRGPRKEPKPTSGGA